MNTLQLTKADEIFNFLSSNGTECRFVGLTIKTPVVNIKVGNPWKAGKKTKSGLYKVSRKIGIINANYNNSVRRRLAEKEGTPFSETVYINGPSWYKHLVNEQGKALPIVQHEDENKREGYLLQYFPQKSLASAYVNEAGEVVDDGEVNPWLYAEKERPDYKPAVISTYLTNIIEIKASGIILSTEDAEEAMAVLSK